MLKKFNKPIIVQGKDAILKGLINNKVDANFGYSGGAIYQHLIHCIKVILNII